MPDFYQPIPSYLTSKRNIVQLVLLTALFSLVFINIYEPFGVNIFFVLTRWQLFFYSSLITLTGVLVVVISRIFMYYFCRKNSLNYWQYIIWVLIEVVAMALFYALYIKFFLHDKRYLPELMLVSIRNTALLLLLPYSVLWLYFSWKDKKFKIDELAQTAAVTDNSKLMVSFTDEKGIMRFSVTFENLLYIEASDNYVSIFYLNKGQISRFMLRNSLKNLEESLKGSGLVRCHRSYMVNFSKVKVIRRDKEGVQLELGIPSAIDLPVSKTYLQQVMDAFSNISIQAD